MNLCPLMGGACGGRLVGRGRDGLIGTRARGETGLVLAGFRSDMEDRIVEADRDSAGASEPPDLYLVDALTYDGAWYRVGERLLIGARRRVGRVRRHPDVG